MPKWIICSLLTLNIICFLPLTSRSTEIPGGWRDLEFFMPMWVAADLLQKKCVRVSKTTHIYGIECGTFMEEKIRKIDLSHFSGPNDQACKRLDRVILTFDHKPGLFDNFLKFFGHLKFDKKPHCYEIYYKIKRIPIVGNTRQPVRIEAPLDSYKRTTMPVCTASYLNYSIIVTEHTTVSKNPLVEIVYNRHKDLNYGDYFNPETKLYLNCLPTEPIK